MDDVINNKRIFKNTLLLYVRMFVIMLVGLWTSRITLSILGIEDYGIFNVVGGVVVLLSFFNSALNGATQRFLSIELGERNIDGYKSAFNASIRIYLILSAIIVLVAETIGLWFLNCQMNIPEGRMTAANWVYQFSIVTFVINMLRTPFNASVIAHERMSFYAYTSIIEAVLKLLVVYVLYIGSLDKLILLALLSTIVSIIVFLWYVFFCMRCFEGCRFLRNYDMVLFKQLFSFSGWSLLGGLAVTGTTKGVNILLNLFCGVTVNAGMGIGNQVAAMVNNFTSNFQVAFRPQIAKGYADRNQEYRELVYRASRVSFFLLLLVSTPFFMKTGFLLDLWLKEVPVYSGEFCIFLLISMLMETLSAPLYMVVQASGNIKRYQIVVSSLFSLNFIFSLIFLSIGVTPVIVVIIRSIVSFMLLVYRIWFVMRLLDISFSEYYKNVINKVMLTTVCSLGLCFLIQYRGDSLALNLLNVIGIVLFSSTCVFFMGLTSEERHKLISIAQDKFTKKP